MSIFHCQTSSNIFFANLQDPESSGYLNFKSAYVLRDHRTQCSLIRAVLAFSNKITHFTNSNHRHIWLVLPMRSRRGSRFDVNEFRTRNNSLIMNIVTFQKVTLAYTKDTLTSRFKCVWSICLMSGFSLHPVVSVQIW